MFSPKAVFFDLDGTLVDSAGDLSVAVALTLAESGMADPGEDKVRTWVGNGTRKLVQRALTGSMDDEPPEELLDQVLPRFSHYYEENLSKNSFVYEGVKETLGLIRDANLPLVCITNKPNTFTLPLLSALGLRNYFDVVVGGDSLKARKPDPAPLLYAAEQINVAIEDCLMVGDSSHDIAAARNAGCSVVAVTYGYNHGEDIRDYRPDTTIDNMRELLSLIRRG